MLIFKSTEKFSSSFKVAVRAEILPRDFTIKKFGQNLKIFKRWSRRPLFGDLSGGSAFWVIRYGPF